MNKSEIWSAVDRAHREAHAAGEPFTVTGLRGACADCAATGAITCWPGGRIEQRVEHDPGCPARAGVVTWRPAAS